MIDLLTCLRKVVDLRLKLRAFSCARVFVEERQRKRKSWENEGGSVYLYPLATVGDLSEVLQFLPERCTRQNNLLSLFVFSKREGGQDKEGTIDALAQVPVHALCTSFTWTGCTDTVYMYLRTW